MSDKEDNPVHSERSAITQTYLLVACEPELEKMTEKHRALLDALGIELVFTGVGKVNATIAASKVASSNADWIINVGTAGSHTHPKGSVVCPDRYAQRDMDATLIMRQFIPDFPVYLTPFEEHMFVVHHNQRFNTLLGVDSGAFHIDLSAHIEGGICWTGDNTHGHTETTKSQPEFEVVEMEAFAIAKVCEVHRIPFTAFKYISDGADENVGEEWAENADGIPWDDILLTIRNAKNGVLRYPV